MLWRCGLTATITRESGSQGWGRRRLVGAWLTAVCKHLPKLALTARATTCTERPAREF